MQCIRCVVVYTPHMWCYYNLIGIVINCGGYEKAEQISYSFFSSPQVFPFYCDDCASGWVVLFVVFM